VKFELFVAARYLRAKRRQAVIGFITAISVIGVAVGVAALIIALAITNGMSRDLRERLLSSTAHVSLMRIQSDGIGNWRALTARLRQLPHVTAAVPAGPSLPGRRSKASFPSRSVPSAICSHISHRAALLPCQGRKPQQQMQSALRPRLWSDMTSPTHSMRKLAIR
jgi:hypothetical protein